MNKNTQCKNILEKCLSKKDIVIDDILEKIEVPLDDNTGVFFYTSYFEGLGNKNSDVDMYIISNHVLPRKLPGKYLNCSGVITYTINNLEFDIEYWNYDEIEKITNECSGSSFIENDLLKILLRLHYGYMAFDNAMTRKIMEKLENINIEKCVTDRYSSMARSTYDDALKMFNAQEYILALDCCRHALWYATGALNSANGHSNLKEKWISKIFIDNEAYGEEDLLNKYLEFQVYSNVPKGNIEKYTTSFLEVIQEFINQLIFC